MKPIALANSLAVIAFLSFSICIVWTVVDQNTFVAFWNSWFHGFDIKILIPEGSLQVNVGPAIFGVVSFTISSWLAGYLLAWLHNQFAK